MEIILDDKYNNFKVNTINNIIVVYGENESGKTHFLNYFQFLLTKRSHYLFSNSKFDENRSSILITEDWDLKKEMNLSKRSSLRNFILKNLITFLEEKDIDLVDKIVSDPDLKLILERVDSILSVNVNKYKIKTTFKFKTTIDLIALLLKLVIEDEDQNEINEKMLSKSEQLMLYIKLMIETKAKDQIFMFDCLESIFIGDKLKEFSLLINELAKDNLVILTFRNPLILKTLNVNFNEILYLRDFKLNKFYNTKRFLIQDYLLKKNVFLKENIDTFGKFNKKVDELRSITEENDYLEIEDNFIKTYLVKLLLDLDIKNKSYLGDLDIYNEFEGFKLSIFLNMNEFILNKLPEYKQNTWFNEMQI